MLVTFRSTATGPVTLFGEHADALLKLMGATGRIPGALGAKDVPAALRALEDAVERLKTQAKVQGNAEALIDAKVSANGSPVRGDEAASQKDSGEEQPPPVLLQTRAVPLIALLRQAAAAGAEVMWQAD